MFGRVKLWVSVLHDPNFDAVDSLMVEEALYVLVVFNEHRRDVLSAVKMFMVIMTFDGVLRGMPVAAVLENNFLL